MMTRSRVPAKPSSASAARAWPTKEQFFAENADRIVACCTGHGAGVRRRAGGSSSWATAAVRATRPTSRSSSCTRSSRSARPLPALALTTDTALLTAVGNDQDFALAFVEQLRMLGQPGDIALGISTSGKSANVNRALQAPAKSGMLTVGFSGRDGGRMPEFCDLLLHRAELQHPPHPGDARDAAAHPLGPDPRHPRRGGRDLVKGDRAMSFDRRGRMEVENDRRTADGDTWA